MDIFFTHVAHATSETHIELVSGVEQNPVDGERATQEKGLQDTTMVSPHHVPEDDTLILSLFV